MISTFQTSLVEKMLSVMVVLPSDMEAVNTARGLMGYGTVLRDGTIFNATSMLDYHQYGMNCELK